MMSNQNNFIHSPFKRQNWKIKTQFFAVIKSRSIFYSSKIVYLKIDWFTGYKENMIEH